MSMGIPAIVTGWSGTADFVDERVGYLVNFTLSKVCARERLEGRGGGEEGRGGGRAAARGRCPRADDPRLS